MKYDLIIVTATRDEELRVMTQNAIDSCLADGADVNVILIETYQKAEYKYVNKLLIYNGEFNYNRALNMGLEHLRGDIVILANNDIYFNRGWSSIGYTMRANGYLSASALSNDPRQKVFRRGDYAYEGYGIGIHLTGWCIFADREVFKKIGRLDETYAFWYSDNVYAEQLKRKGIVHALICNVVVLHFVSRTLVKQRAEIRHLLTYAEGKRFSANYSKNLQKKL